MKNISEMYENPRSIKDIIEEEQIDEGLKDVIKNVADHIKNAAEKVVGWITGAVAKIGSYFVPVGSDGELLAAVSPLTAGQAMKDGLINKESTFVALDSTGARLVGWSKKIKDAKNLPAYKIKTLDYWKQINESLDDNVANINEVHLENEDPESRYSTICDSKELKSIIQEHLDNPKLPPLLIWGAPGIGKTAIIDAVIAEMSSKGNKWDSITKTLSNETPDNFFLPTYVDVNGEKRATDVPKTWIPVYKKTGDPAKDKEASDKLGYGLLFVDELSRATQQVQNVVLPLINERRLGDNWYLGDNWVVIAASNRASDDTAQTELNTTLLNRFEQVWYEPTCKTWSEWANKQGFMSPLLTQWLNMPASEENGGGKFYYFDPNETYDSTQPNPTALICTPRSWTNAMRHLAMYSYTGNLEGFAILDIPTRTLQRTLGAYIPAQAIDAFVSFLDVVRSIGNFDAAVESVWKNGGKGLKIDKKVIRKITLPLAQLIVCAHAQSLPTQKEWENLCQWLIDSDSDQLASYVLDVFREVFVNKYNIPASCANELFVMPVLIDPKSVAHYKTGEAEDANGRKIRLESIASRWKPFMDRWGLKELGEFPNYRDGLNNLGAKYAQVFKSTVVNGQEALG